MSNGTPTSAMSRSGVMSWRAVRMKVAMPAKRGVTDASAGWYRGLPLIFEFARFIGRPQCRLKEHIASCFAIGRGGILRLIVADAVLAWDEDHRGRHPARHMEGVVAGAR